MNKKTLRLKLMQNLIYFWVILTLFLISTTKATIDTSDYSIVPDTTIKKEINEKKFLMEQKKQTEILKKNDLKLDTLLMQLNIDTNNVIPLPQ